MKEESFDRLYQDVPVEQRETLRTFRATHPYRTLNVGGVPWEYIASGEGSLTMLLLGGGLSVGETSFQNILRFEKCYRVLSPSYPPVGKVRRIADGLAAILDREGVTRTNVFGHSLGAGVAHAFVRLYPDRVDKLVLDGFGLYTASSLRAAKFFFKLPAAWLKAYYRRRFRTLLAGADEATRAFYQAYVEEPFTRLHTNETLMGQMKLLIDFFDHPDEYDLFRPVERPGQVLLILAEDDRGFKSSEREALKASYPGAMVHSFPSGGHLSGFTHPKEFNHVLDNFLGAPASDCEQITGNDQKHDQMS